MFLGQRFFFFALTGTSGLAFFVHDNLRSYLVVLQEEASAEDSVRLAGRL